MAGIDERLRRRSNRCEIINANKRLPSIAWLVTDHHRQAAVASSRQVGVIAADGIDHKTIHNRAAQKFLRAGSFSSIWACRNQRQRAIFTR